MIKVINIGYGGYDVLVDNDISIKEVIRDSNVRCLYEDENVNYNDIVKFGFSEDGYVCELKDGSIYVCCDRGMMGCRCWIENEEYSEEYKKLFEEKEKEIVDDLVYKFEDIIYDSLDYLKGCVKDLLKEINKYYSK